VDEVKGRIGVAGWARVQEDGVGDVRDGGSGIWAGVVEGPNSGSFESQIRLQNS
jgi:hypothetical protein